MHDGFSKEEPEENRDESRDDVAVRTTLEKAGPAVRRFLFAMGVSWDDAEDAAQETLLRAWRDRASFDGRADVRTWIFRIARNHYLDVVRQRDLFDRKRPMTALHLAREPPPPLWR